jgi:RimJ/RimL family protein N-acetyltransferase
MAVVLVERRNAASQTAFTAGRELAFAIIDRPSGRVAGRTRFRCFEAAHCRVEIGFTFLGRSWQRTHINTQAKYAMLEYAFERWGLNRVELLTDVLNTPSRNAIVRIGATEEGVLNAHMVMRDGRIRDSVIYGITVGDWPAVKAMLLGRMSA